MKAIESERVAMPARVVSPDDSERRETLVRSLKSAQDNVETLRLYAKSVVRMLELCEAEVGSLRKRARVPGRLRRTPQPMDLDFVREDVDRLVGETRAQLALVHIELQQLDRPPEPVI